MIGDLWIIFICAAISFLALLTGCTMTFQNIDTHGTATDLVDENLTTSPVVSPNINVPVSIAPASTGK